MECVVALVKAIVAIDANMVIVSMLIVSDSILLSQSKSDVVSQLRCVLLLPKTTCE